jgi:hypothetical protein
VQRYRRDGLLPQDSQRPREGRLNPEIPPVPEVLLGLGGENSNGMTEPLTESADNRAAARSDPAHRSAVSSFQLGALGLRCPSGKDGIAPIFSAFPVCPDVCRAPSTDQSYAATNARINAALMRLSLRYIRTSCGFCGPLSMSPMLSTPGRSWRHRVRARARPRRPGRSHLTSGLRRRDVRMAVRSH